MLQIHLLYTNIPKAKNAVAEHYKFPSIHYQRTTVTGKSPVYGVLTGSTQSS